MVVKKAVVALLDSIIGTLTLLLVAAVLLSNVSRLLYAKDAVEGVQVLAGMVLVSYLLLRAGQWLKP